MNALLFCFKRNLYLYYMEEKEIDKKLLEIYYLGFTSCSLNDFDKIKNSNFSDLERKAYLLGWDHYIIGDDVRSVDYLSTDQILELIKK